MEQVCVECGSDEVTFFTFCSIDLKSGMIKSMERIDEDYWCGECDGSVDLREIDRNTISC